MPTPGSTWSLMCEVSESRYRPVNQQSLIDSVVDGAVATGLVKDARQILSRWSYRAAYGYPVPGLERDAALAQLLPEFERFGVYSRGRFGLWKYEVSNQDHSFMQGVELVERIVNGRREITSSNADVVNCQKTSVAVRALEANNSWREWEASRHAQTRSSRRTNLDSLMGLRTVVIIATRGRPREVSAILNILALQTVLPDMVLVSACDHNDLEQSMLDKENIRAVWSSRTGRSEKPGLSFRAHYDYDIIVFFDDDFIPSRFWIERIQKLLAMQPEVGCMTGRVLEDGVTSGGLERSYGQSIVDNRIGRWSPMNNPGMQYPGISLWLQYGVSGHDNRTLLVR